MDAREVVARFEQRHGVAAADAAVVELAGWLSRWAGAIGVVGMNDAATVLDLWSSFTESAQRSPYAVALVRNILAVTSWSLAARIAFLRRHLAGREIIAEDEELGVLFGVERKMTS